ncbi:uncharacterized protein KD926_005910 [Aspergillus affinis]|uniref:uncharacterized protein n=1 Tax=Aspergillus affinis TaxID=1070780 RepID=UPI0022FEB5B7|nr:uncharacterized protein KD926_005910 [Aspergillus affinis]KAI9045966.1 hypothetical protein KD926_005910 [Aspergillus affinis]
MLLQVLQWLLDSLTPTVLLYGTTAFLVLLGCGLTIVLQSSNASTIRRQLKHLKLQGIKPSNSNMNDQYDSQYAIPEDTDPASNEPIRIKSIYIHPIKSCGPIELDRALLTKTGFLYDRCFALATETVSPGSPPEWKFISQRTKPTMSLIQTYLWTSHESSDPNDPLVQAGGCLVVTFPDPDTDSRPLRWISRLDAFLHTGNLHPTPEISFIVPLHPTPSQISSYDISIQKFGIHGRPASGLNISALPDIATALPKLKRFLRIPDSQPLALLRCTPDTLLPTTKNLAPLENIGSRAVHGYTDQQPININSISSVHSVSGLLPPENQPLNALRFRANIWISGSVAYDEETWKRYRIIPKREASSTQPDTYADVSPTLSVVCRTSRCTMPSVNPDTGIFDTDVPPAGRKRGKPQPSTTLVAHRTVESGNASALGYLGMHCVPEDSGLKEAEKQGRGLVVSVGDEIEVLERGEHLYGSTGSDY